MPEIKLRVSKLMQEQNLNIQGLVDQTGLSYPTALAISKDRVDQIRLDTLAKLYKGLNCKSMDDLLECVE